MVEREVPVPGAPAAPRHSDWPRLLRELATQLDTGAIYDRELDDLTRALNEILSGTSDVPRSDSGIPSPQSVARARTNVDLRGLVGLLRRADGSLGAGRPRQDSRLRATRFNVNLINMNSRRRYEMSARAEAAAATGDRIMSAARARLGRAPYDTVTLDDIAADAGVTVQTVLRRFGSKEGVVRAIGAAAQRDIFAERGQAPSGDVAAAIANLVEHYEQSGDEVLHLLWQEQRVAAFAEITATGRKFHAQWVTRIFAPWLAQRSGADRARLRAQLVAVCDVYVWYLLRRQAGLSRHATRQAIGELVNGVLP